MTRLPTTPLMAAALLAMVLYGCARDTPSSTGPRALPPLPPTDGTSVSILLSEQAALDLTDAQRTDLQELQEQLDALNRPLEDIASNATRSSGQRPSRAGKRGGGMRGGGMRGGGMRGGGMRGSGMRGGGMRGGGMRGGNGGPSQQQPSTVTGRRPSARTQQLRAMMMHNNQVALARAFQRLDSKQQEAALVVLADHGHDGPDPALATADYHTLPADEIDSQRGSGRKPRAE